MSKRSELQKEIPENLLETMEGKKTLLQKYEIALSHLDFRYIADCKDAREMEKIVQILRSGEEGFFPDLTRCAEDKLRELKPSSRLFRYEEPIHGRDYLGSSEWKPIYDWTYDIKVKDQKLEAFKNTVNGTECQELHLPPIRRGGKINQNKGETCDLNSGIYSAPTAARKDSTRIKSTDYQKWDQYDPDEEILRMDLAEERVKEEVERKNRLNKKKSITAQKITELTMDTYDEEKLLATLTDVEREHLAEEYRMRGNEYFRAKEYESAVYEYSRAIQINPCGAAPAYNNRAITKIKLQNYLEAIEDCEHCLRMEPNNLKAHLRLAEATYGYGRRRESYDLYMHVLELDPSNTVALKATTELHSQLGELPPPSATRIQIREYDPMTSKDTSVKKLLVHKKSTTPAKPKEYDLADLIVPNRVVKSQLATAAEALSNLRVSETQKKSTETQSTAVGNPSVIARTTGSELRLPNVRSVGKVLIEEI